MVTKHTWQEFCAFYYEYTHDKAKACAGKLLKNLGGVSQYVDMDYVVDSAVLDALQTAYEKYDPSKVTKITNYLSTLVHNAVVDTLKAENKLAASKKDELYADHEIEEVAAQLPTSAFVDLLEKLHNAIDSLSASDQIILQSYMDNGEDYVSDVVRRLGITANCAHVRKNRILEKLPRLMGVTRSQYIDMKEEAAFASNGMSMFFITTKPSRSLEEPAAFWSRANSICPELDLSATVETLAKILQNFSR